MACAERYREISESMGWSSWDYHEIGAKAGLISGDVESLESHRNELYDQLSRRGYLAKRFIGQMFEKLDASSPRPSKCRSVTPLVTASSLR